MKFKVGDKVRAIKDGEYTVTTKSNNWMGIVTKISEKIGYFDAKTIKAHNAGCIGNEYYSLDEDCFELIKKPIKQELLAMPDGTKITTNWDSEHNEFYKLDDSFANDDNDEIAYYDINDDLTLDDVGYGTKIIKIEKPIEYETVYDFSAEMQEMTIADIEKALGHPVKIVKEAE